MVARAKFTVVSITEYEASCVYRNAKSVKLSCLYDALIPEDRRFFDATPTGTIEMYINNPAVLERFAAGKKFYVDFTPAEQ